MYSLFFTVGLRYNRLATGNFVLTYAVLTKLRTKTHRKFTVLKKFYNSNFFSFFYPKKKHGGPEKFYLRTVKPTRKTHGKTLKTA